MSPEIATPVENSPQPFIEGSQVDTSPQLTQGETEKGGIVGPGQEGLVDEYIREQEQAQEEDAILGKFKNPQELAKAYAELQRKMGEQSSNTDEQPAASDPEPQADAPSDRYTKESASERYGSEAVEALEAKGIDLPEVMRAADSGQDISEHYDTLAETFNVSRDVVEHFVGKTQAEQSASGLSDADASALLAEVGGQDSFNELSGWAKGNLGADELASYNAVVDSGNKEAISWALKAMQARRAAPDSVVEPQLYGGGTPTDTVMRFESQQQVLDAMNKKNDRGQRLYDVDEAYRHKVQMVLQSSDVF
jgi:hypothetical protein